jgi:hypothetical protein
MTTSLEHEPYMQMNLYKVILKRITWLIVSILFACPIAHTNYGVFILPASCLGFLLGYTSKVQEPEKLTLKDYFGLFIS